MLLVSSGKSGSIERAGSLLEDLLDSGMVDRRFRQWVAAQGGRLEEMPYSPGDFDKVTMARLIAPESGWLESIDCEMLGNIARRCGAGRMSKDDVICDQAGLVINVGISEQVEAGDELARMYIDNQRLDMLDELHGLLRGMFWCWRE